MSKLSALDQLLQRYKQLQYHQDPVLFQRLQDVQQWQKNRLKHSHQGLFSEKNNRLMADYFVNRLYKSMSPEIIYNENIGLVFQGKSVHMLYSILWSF